MRLKIWLKLLLILAVTVLLSATVLPRPQKEFLNKVPLVGEKLANLKVNLGLDLQGGTHLDYRVVTQGINEIDIPKVVAGVKEVIERRVNGLGVSEPNIFTSKVGDEQHIIVELAGIKDIEQAKAIVGKTIQLEFKEENTEVDPNLKKEIENKAKDFLAQAKANPEEFENIFADFEDKPKITLEKDEAVEVDGEVVDEGWVWVEDLPNEELKKVAEELNPGEVYPSLVKPKGEFFVNSQGNFKEREGYYVVKLLAKEKAEKQVFEEEERKAAHILIAYQGSDSASEDITRTKEEAEAKANEILEKALSGEDFATLAKENSDGPSADKGGDLGFFKRSAMVESFSDAVFGATEFGVIPEVVESDFGFHVIKYEDKKAEINETKMEDRVKFAKAFFNTAPDGWKATGLTGQHFRRADVGSDQNTLKPIVNIYFTQTAITESQVNWWLLVWYLLVLASGISLFSSAIGVFMSEGHRENLKRDRFIAIGSAIIFALSIYGITQTQAEKTTEVSAPGIESSDGEVAETDKAGVDLFAEITKRNLHKPIAIFLDGLPIIDTNGDGKIDSTDPAYAPVVQSEILNGQAVISGLKSYEEANELAQNLNTGAIPAPVKLSSQFTVGATLGESALETSLEAGFYGIIAVMVFMIVLYRLPGFIASLALAIYGVLLIFALEVFGVVLTLAGVAGVILSIGMAVDANILIFERMKEELKLGKSLGRSVEDGFTRAWSSIRDSNVSSIITCVILYWFGSSIIKGFALTLSVGILLSMFSAITVSRNFLRIAVNYIKDEKFYGVKK